VPLRKEADARHCERMKFAFALCLSPVHTSSSSFSCFSPLAVCHSNGRKEGNEAGKREREERERGLDSLMLPSERGKERTKKNGRLSALSRPLRLKDWSLCRTAGQPSPAGRESYKVRKRAPERISELTAFCVEGKLAQLFNFPI
jgi:hypothetical protein